MAEYELKLPKPIQTTPVIVPVMEEGAIECEVVDAETDKRYRLPLRKVKNAGVDGVQANGSAGVVTRNTQPKRPKNIQYVCTLYRLGMIAFRATLNGKQVFKRFYLPEFVPHDFTLSEQKRNRIIQLISDAGVNGISGDRLSKLNKRYTQETQQLLEYGEMIRVDSINRINQPKTTYYHRDFAPTTAKENEDEAILNRCNPARERTSRDAVR